MRLIDIIRDTEPLNINANIGTEQATEHMWGFCKTCDFAALCRGGCSWTSHVFFNKRGNNPYCHHRALTKAAEGKRERVTIHELAPGIPFDNGTFDLREEAIDAPWPKDDELHFTRDAIQWPAAWLEEDPALTQMIERAIRTTVSAYKGS